jgi:hypothetical protein
MVTITPVFARHCLAAFQAQPPMFPLHANGYFGDVGNDSRAKLHRVASASLTDIVA